MVEPSKYPPRSADLNIKPDPDGGTTVDIKREPVTGNEVLLLQTFNALLVRET